MRPALLSMLFLLVFAGASSAAFDVDSYLTENESSATITEEFFNLNGTIYYIINISGQPTFLIKADEIVEGKNEIESTLKSYYSSKYMLTQNETDKLLGYFVSFNNSRNDGGRWVNKEEFYCRQILRLEEKDKELWPGCVDDSSCNATIYKLCALQYFKDATHCSDPADFLPALQDFAYSSQGLETIIADIFSKLSTISTDTIGTYLSQIDAYIPTLKEYSETIVKTPFRYPAVGEDCPFDSSDLLNNCYGACPDFVYNTSALDSADSYLSTLISKIEPLAQYKSISDKIYNNTRYRIQLRKNMEARELYLSIYHSVKLVGAQVKNKTFEALKLVSNATVQQKLAKLAQTEASIEAMINADNFTDVNSSISQYSKDIESLNASADELLAIYDGALETYKSATVYIFLAEGKSLGPEDTKKLLVLKQRKLQLDGQMGAGLTATQYSDLVANYQAVINDGKALASKAAPENALYIFTRMANKFVDALDILFAKVRPLSYAERAQISAYLPISLSALLFLSFSCMVIFLFLVYYAITSSPINKLILVGLSLMLVFILGLVSVSLFLSLDKSYNKLEYGDFVDMARYSKNVAIAVQKDGGDAATLAAMDSCAASISSALTESNITYSLYELDGDACSKGGESVPACLDKNSYPLILLKASATDSAVYSGLLVKQAAIQGTESYYTVCPFAEAFKIAK